MISKTSIQFLFSPLFIIIIGILSLSDSTYAAQTKNYWSLYISGPSVSKHFDPYHNQYNDFHPGIGAELYYHHNRWFFGVNGHYMLKDSTDLKAYWMGGVTGFLLGKPRKIWIEPFVLIGGIKKAEYQNGQFAFFAIPCLSFGYNGIAVNVVYIPKLNGVTYPILLMQIKIRLAIFTH